MSEYVFSLCAIPAMGPQSFALTVCHMIGTQQTRQKTFVLNLDGNVGSNVGFGLARAVNDAIIRIIIFMGRMTLIFSMNIMNLHLQQHKQLVYDGIVVAVEMPQVTKNAMNCVHIVRVQRELLTVTEFEMIAYEYTENIIFQDSTRQWDALNMEYSLVPDAGIVFFRNVREHAQSTTPSAGIVRYVGDSKLNEIALPGLITPLQIRTVEISKGKVKHFYVKKREEGIGICATEVLVEISGNITLVDALNIVYEELQHSEIIAYDMLKLPGFSVGEGLVPYFVSRKNNGQGEVYTLWMPVQNNNVISYVNVNLPFLPNMTVSLTTVELDDHQVIVAASGISIITLRNKDGIVYTSSSQPHIFLPHFAEYVPEEEDFELKSLLRVPSDNDLSPKYAVSEVAGSLSASTPPPNNADDMELEGQVPNTVTSPGIVLATPQSPGVPQ